MTIFLEGDIIKKPFPFADRMIHKKLTSAQLICMGFAGIILFGALLLMLPISSKSGNSTSFVDSLFTATSATCVTGLIVVDTFFHWSVFGQTVIIMLIQIGGLGVMTVATMFTLLVKKNISMNERINIMESLNLNDMHDMRKLVGYIVKGTFIFEGIGALIFAIRFSFDFGVVKGIYLGIFQSISAFCNAGFDLMGIKGTPFASLTSMYGDYVVNIITMLLIIIGGLGFMVWGDILKSKKKKRLSLYAKLVLSITAILIVSGTVIFAVTEWNNPETIGFMTTPQKILASAFQSVTLRTAGFNTINQAGMRDGSFMVSCLLMFVGGSSGSTAGGIKTVTFGLIILSVIASARGRRDVVVFKKKINNEHTMRAISIATLTACLLFAGIFAISVIENFKLRDIIYECFSAFGTVGVTMGITPFLSVASQWIIIFMMFFGRVGILTITFAIALSYVKNKNLISYPEGKILIG